MNDEQHTGATGPQGRDAVMSVTHAEWDNLPGEAEWKDEMLRTGRVEIRER